MAEWLRQGGIAAYECGGFSGTTEGRSFSRALAALGAAVTVCVATELGAEEQAAPTASRCAPGGWTPKE
mgnify:CR=1 FL=1